MRQDAWLSDVLGFPVYATDPDGEVPSDERRSLTYTKIDVEDVGAVARLTALGFAVVDVNVTLSRTGDATPPAAPEIRVGVADREQGLDLADVAGRCFRYSRFHLDPLIPDELAHKVKREWVLSYANGQRGVELLSAFAGSEPVGFLAVLEQSGDRLIDLIGVAPEAQGRGVGRALVTAFVKRHAAQARRLVVGTQVANTASLRLYERLGFTVSRAAYVLHLHRGI